MRSTWTVMLELLWRLFRRTPITPSPTVDEVTEVLGRHPRRGRVFHDALERYRNTAPMLEHFDHGPGPAQPRVVFWDEKDPAGSQHAFWNAVEPRPTPGGRLAMFSSDYLRHKTIGEMHPTVDFTEVIHGAPPGRTPFVRCRTCSAELDVHALILASVSRGYLWLVEAVLAFAAEHKHKAYVAPRAFRALVTAGVRADVMLFHARRLHGFMWHIPLPPRPDERMRLTGIEAEPKIGTHDIEASLRRAPEEQARRERERSEAHVAAFKAALGRCPYRWADTPCALPFGHPGQHRS